MSIAMDERPALAQSVSRLDQLRRLTRIAVDSANFDVFEKYAPQDATTNPTLILKAAQRPEYAAIVERSVSEARKISTQPGYTMHHLLVSFGVEILQRIPGRASTETSANLAFSTNDLIAESRFFISLYKQKGIPRERVLIKLASTWEGIQAAEVLEKEGIHCNMTLLFSLAQAAACAEAGATLISPFVGRILDWHKKNTGHDFSPAEDPGVLSVRSIYSYFKKFGYETEIMGASFRNTGEVLELAGCDLLTVSPDLLDELATSEGAVEVKLRPELSREYREPKLLVDESQFRWLLNQDAMATEKLAEGIRTFAADAVKLERYVAERFH